MMNHENMLQNLRFFGRTLYDEQAGAVFFDWSGAGFEVAFEAKKLEITLTAIESTNQFEGTLWPCVSVFLDDSVEPTQVLYIDQPSQRVTLFESDAPQKHRIRVVKRTENDKGKIGITDIAVDGAFLPIANGQERIQLEFIGDSISCGFGNEANQREGAFVPQEQNGLKSYCAVAAELLHADYHNISVSGISLCAPLDPNFTLEIPEVAGLSIKVKAMEDYYEYTDRLLEETLGRSDGFSKWDFRAHQADAIMLNLGTNDSYRIKSAKDPSAEIAHFQTRYTAFLRTIRRLNGSKPIICCTLGPMDYFLYDNIVQAVQRYQDETGDERIFCYKFGGMYPLLEGFGAGDHPSVITHSRMGRELAEQLKPRLLQG